LDWGNSVAEEKKVKAHDSQFALAACYVSAK